MAQQPVQRRGMKRTRHKTIHVMSAATCTVGFHAQSSYAQNATSASLQIFSYCPR